MIAFLFMEILFGSYAFLIDLFIVPFFSLVHSNLKKIFLEVYWIQLFYVWKHDNFSCSVMSDSLWLHDCSLPGSSVHGIFQARILEWVSQSRLQGICPTQGSNLGFLHYRQIQFLLILVSKSLWVTLSVYVFLSWLSFMAFCSLWGLPFFNRKFIYLTMYLWGFLRSNVELTLGRIHVNFFHCYTCGSTTSLNYKF